jgi:hypothetical protein
LRVIRDNLLALLQAARFQRFDEPLAIRQRMAPIRAGLRPRQVAVEMQIMRAGQMSGEIRLFAGFRIGQIEPAVDDEHAARCLGEPFREIGRGDQSGVVSVGHDVSSMRAMAAPLPAAS